MLVNPDHFGRRRDAPRATTSARPSQVAAALIQHRAAVAVLDHFDGRMTDARWAELGALLGARWQTLRRKLYGESMATLEDLAGWTIVIGIDMFPVFDELDELR